MTPFPPPMRTSYLEALLLEPKAQQDPQEPWSLTGVITPESRQSTLSGSSSKLISGGKEEDDRLRRTLAAGGGAVFQSWCIFLPLFAGGAAGCAGVAT